VSLRAFVWLIIYTLACSMCMALSTVNVTNEAICGKLLTSQVKQFHAFF
jgi:hypothetical protein